MVDASIIIFVALVAIVFFFCMLDSFNVVDEKKWPPIDDEEFLRRCGPGVNRDIALRVRRIVSEQLGVDYDRVYPEQNFVDDLGCG